MICLSALLSLLNNDYKAFTKILEIYLERVVPSLVHFDQTGLAKGCHSSINLIRLFIIMHDAASPQHPAVMLSLDAEKAFDRAEWSKLILCFRKNDFGSVCMQWIGALFVLKQMELFLHPFS